MNINELIQTHHKILTELNAIEQQYDNIFVEFDMNPTSGAKIRLMPEQTRLRTLYDQTLQRLESTTTKIVEYASTYGYNTSHTDAA